MFLLRGVIFWLCVSCLAVVVQAQEVIKNFDVTIDVKQNGDYRVTENITVNVEGTYIRRGIFRDLPRYRKYQGRTIPVRMKVKSVKRNDKKEPYDLSNEGNAKRIRIGDADVFLPYGEHSYEIIYDMKDEIRRDERFDEVYWNVTGSYWNFPIQNAKATVNMPDNAEYQGYEVWTGGYGATDKNAKFSRSDGSYVFETTKALNIREGMTISLRVNKGVIGPEQASTSRFLWWVRNGAMSIISLAFLAIFGFYYRNWARVGRDPAKLPVFARYGPPKGYSPAAVSRIHYKGIRGHNALIATLVGIATKNRLTIDAEKKSKTILEVVSGHKEAKPLNAEEDLLFSKLFSGSKKVTLRKKYHATFNSAYTKLKNHLNKKFGESYYKVNGAYIFGGILLSVIAVVIAITQLYGQSSPIFWWIFGAIIAVNILFMFLMPAPTNKGNQIASEIEGFRLYLKTAEKVKLDAVKVGSNQPPPMSIEHYEAMLPYAIALGVEKPWSKYFEKTIPTEAANYKPGWTSMSRGNYGSFSKLTDSMVSNLSSGATSAQPSSSGSSSSGGGGFSGSGGGGGGGGGW